MDIAGIEVRISGDRARDDVRRLEGSLNRLIRSAGSTEGAFDRLADQIDDTCDSLSDAGRKTQEAEGSFTRLSRSVTGLQGAFAALAASAVAADFIGIITTAQRLSAQYRFLTGTAEAYAAAQEYIATTAQRLGVGLTTAREGYAQLLNLQRSGLVTLEQGRALFEGLTNASTALGASNEQLGQVLYGLAQALASPRLQADELAQVMDPLPGLLAEMDKAAGQASGGFRRMVNEGQVTAEMFRTTLIRALSTFEGAAAGAAGNIEQNWTRVRNQYQLLVEELERPVSSALVPLLEGTRTAVQLAAEHLDTLGTAAGVLAGILAARLAASLAATVTELTAKVAATQAATAAETAAAAAAVRTAEADRLAAVAALDQARARATQAAAGTAYARVAAVEVFNANARLTAATAAATAATNAHAAALANASIAARGFAAAAGLGNAALALVGGPAGLALLAAGGILYLALRTTDAERAANAARSANEELQRVLGKGVAVTRDAANAAIAKAQADLNAADAALTLARAEASRHSATLRPDEPIPGAAAGAFAEEAKLQQQREALEKTIREKREEYRDLLASPPPVAVASQGTLSALSQASQGADDLIKNYRQQREALERQVALLGDAGQAAQIRYELENGALKGLAPLEKQYLLDLAAEVDAHGAAGSAAKKAGGEQANAAKQLLDAFQDRVAGLQEEISLYGQTGRAAAIRYEVEQGSLSDLSRARRDYLVGLGEELDKLERQARAQGEVAQLIEQTATPTERYAARLAELSKLETDLRATGGPVSPEAEQALQRAREEAQGLVDAANPMAEIFRSTAERIQGAFTGLFEGIFDKGLSSFRDLGRSILDFFKRTLAQMAGLALARPVLVPIVTGLGGALGVSQSVQAGVLGQIGGAAGGAGAGGLLSGLGGIGNVLNPFGNAAGLGLSNVLTGLASTGLGNLPGVGTFLGQTAGGAIGLSNLALGGAGLLGGLGGNLIGSLFGGAGGTGGGIGGSLGSIIGLATPLGPVGALLGGLLGSVGGGLLGSLFGNEKRPFASLATSTTPGRFRPETNTTASQGAFGLIGFVDELTKRIKTEDLQKFTDALAQLDTQLAQALLPDQIDRIRTALDGFVTAHQRGAISFEEMARQRLGVVVDALGDDFAALARRIEGLPVEDAYALVQAFATLQQAIPALDRQIAALGRSGLESFGDQISALEDNVSRAVQSLRDALDTGDLAQAAQLLAGAQSAVLERYQTEVQLVQELAAQVEAISRAGDEFIFSLTERIANLQPPGIDLEAAYSRRGQELYNAIVETQDPARQFALLQEFTDAYDRWFQTAADRIDAATEDGIRNFERYRNAVEDAAQVRLDALERELQIAQQWTGVLNSAQQLIDRLRYSSANPLPTGARLALAQGEVSTARTRLATTTGEARPGAAQELIEALERQLELGQEIYARPSREYLSLYNETISEIANLRNLAAFEGRSAEEIQAKIARINEGTAATVAGIDTQIAQWRARQEADQQALRAQALQGYETIREFGSGLSAVMEGQARSQLNVLTAGLSVSQFIAQQQSRAVDLLTDIRDRISGALTGSFATGTPYVQSTGLAMIHQGERILTAGENQTFGPAVDRMLAQGSLPHFQSGGLVPRDMIAGLHQGERLVPAGKQETPAPVVYEQAVNLTVNVQGGGDPKRAAEEVRREVMSMLPAIKKGLRTA